MKPIDGDVGGHVMGVHPQSGSIGPAGDVTNNAGIMPCQRGIAFLAVALSSLQSAGERDDSHPSRLEAHSFRALMRALAPLPY